MLQIGDNLNENGQCANFRWGQCYRGKSRGGEVRLCTQWSNGNISESKGQLFGLAIHTLDNFLAIHIGDNFAI